MIIEFVDGFYVFSRDCGVRVECILHFERPEKWKGIGKIAQRHKKSNKRLL
jgi:hypothetical protein